MCLSTSSSSGITCDGNISVWTAMVLVSTYSKCWACVSGEALTMPHTDTAHSTRGSWCTTGSDHAPTAQFLLERNPDPFKHQLTERDSPVGGQLRRPWGGLTTWLLPMKSMCQEAAVTGVGSVTVACFGGEGLRTGLRETSAVTLLLTECGEVGCRTGE